MAKRTDDPRQLEIVYVFPEPTTIPPAPAFPVSGTAIHFRDTGSGILVLGPDDREIGHVDPTQAPVLSRVLDCITRDTITAEMGKADENGFEVVLHRRIDGDEPKRNVVRCTRVEPVQIRQAA